MCRNGTHVPTCQKVTWLALSYRGDRLSIDFLKVKTLQYTKAYSTTCMVHKARNIDVLAAAGAPGSVIWNSLHREHLMKSTPPILGLMEERCFFHTL